VAHAAAVDARTDGSSNNGSSSSSSTTATAGSSGASGGVDLGAMFLERLSSNGESSSSNGTSGISGDTVERLPRVPRHDRHLQRRKTQRLGRRGGGSSAQQPQQQQQDSSPLESEDEGFDEQSSWQDARRGHSQQQRARQEQQHEQAAARSAQDVFLDSFINRLLSPVHHEWRDGPRGNAAPPPASRKDEALPQTMSDALPTMEASNVASVFANFSREGRLRAALQVLEIVANASRADVAARLSHRYFLRAASAAGEPRAVLRFLQLLPPEAADGRTYNMALDACARNADLETATSITALMTVRGAALDAIHRTTLIACATRALNLGAAFRYYAEARQEAADQTAAGLGAAADAARLDGWVYGALVAACAAGIKAAANDRKEQLVLLERAFGVVDDAAACNVHLEAPVWNALLMCAGESDC